MKRALMPFMVIASVFAFANASAKTMPMSDFEDGTTMGWGKGGAAEIPVTVEQEGNGNYYMKVESSLDVHDKRMVFFSGKEWRGNYNVMGVQSIKVRMKNMGDETLNMRLAYGNRVAELRTRYISTNAQDVAADGEWHNLTFNLGADFVTMVPVGGHGASSTIWPPEEVLGAVDIIRFVHGENYNRNDPIATTLYVDDIMSVTSTNNGESAGEVAPVPLPAAAWFLMTGMASLFGVNRVKRTNAQS